MSAPAFAATQDIPAALQLPLYQALATDTAVEFDNGCTTLTAQGLTGCFDAAGARFTGAHKQSLALELTGYGRGATLNAVTPKTPAINGNHVRYEHDGIIEWWQVLPMGFEQGFTVAERIDGQGDLVIALAGSQPATLENGTLSFGNLRYGKLVVSDANGQVVPSAFETRGKRVLISVNDAEATYPLTVDPLVWIEQKVTAGGAATDNDFGIDVAIDDDTAIIGAMSTEVGGNAGQGVAYVFIRADGAWSQQARLTASDGAATDRFGQDVALADDTAVIGANGAATGGAAYVYTRTAGTWSEQQKLTASDATSGDSFSSGIAVDNDMAMIGASLVDVGGNNAQGAAYVFTRSGGTWSQSQKLTASDGGSAEFFGGSIALDDDTAVIGALRGGSNSEGAAYVFTRTGGNWSEQQKLSASDGASRDRFGGSVALDDDTAVIGASEAAIGGNQEQGAAYVFTRTSSTWSQRTKLTAGDGNANDNFGESVALADDTVVVGANSADPSPGSVRGAAYVFNRTGGTWDEQVKLTPSGGEGSSGFGESVALDDDSIAVGTFFNGAYTDADPRAAYFYGASDLDLAVSAPATVDAGDNYTSQAIVTNNAGDASPALTVLIPIPAAATFVSANATQGSCSEGSGTVACVFGAIAGNAGRATANVTLKATGGGGATIDNTTRIDRATPELRASETTEIEAGSGAGASGGAPASTSVGHSGGGCTLASKPGAPDPVLPLLGLLAALTLSRRRWSAWLQRRRG